LFGSLEGEESIGEGGEGEERGEEGRGMIIPSACLDVLILSKGEESRYPFPKILAFSLLGANMMNMNTYIISIPAPVPLIVDTKILFGDTKGRPYLFNFFFSCTNQN
jgi:hypothetical protein